MVEPKPPTLTDYDINIMIDTLDQYYSSVKQGDLWLKDKHNEFKPYTDDPWARFTSIRLPCVNHDFDKAYGVIVGVSPVIHGRHHKACNWIINDLYDTVIDYFPDDFACNSNFEFRSLYGVRAGEFYS